MLNSIFINWKNNIIKNNIIKNNIIKNKIYYENIQNFIFVFNISINHIKV